MNVNTQKFSLAENFWLQLYQDLISLKLEGLERYSNAVERLLLDESIKLSDELSNRAQKLPEDARDEFLEDFADDFHELKDAFPQTLRASLFIHCHAVFEHALAQTANHFHREMKLELSPKELKHEGITRSQNYLKKVAKKGFPDTQPSWQKIKMFNMMRNQFMHADGHLPKDPEQREQLKKFAKQYPNTLQLSEHDSIKIISEEFSQIVLKTFREFFKQLVLKFKTVGT